MPDTCRNNTRYDLTYLSLGAGVQSTALYLLAEKGLCGIVRPDIAIFADTGEEAPWTYETLWKLQERGGIPILVAQAQSPMLGPTFLRLPAFTDGAGQLRRQCTRELKIASINRTLREYLHYLPRQRMKHNILGYIGISYDENQRWAAAREPWLIFDYPLLRKKITREECEVIISTLAPWLGTVKKSSCVMCPYHSDREWRNVFHAGLKDKIVAFDEAIRNSTKARCERQVFLHRKCTPIADAIPDDNQTTFGYRCDNCFTRIVSRPDDPAMTWLTQGRAQNA
jgi:PAS domain-containing protein